MCEDKKNETQEPFIKYSSLGHSGNVLLFAEDKRENQCSSLKGRESVVVNWVAAFVSLFWNGWEFWKKRTDIKVEIKDTGFWFSGKGELELK